jgi:hypothetical protein
VAVFPRWPTPNATRSRLPAHQQPPAKKKSQTRNINIGRIHDVFVDIHGFESHNTLLPNDQQGFSYIQPYAHSPATDFQAALLAEFAHRCTPVTTCIPRPDSGFHTHSLLTNFSRAWVREQRWLQAAVEILRWWCECGLSTVEVSRYRGRGSRLDLRLTRLSLYRDRARRKMYRVDERLPDRAHSSTRRRGQIAEGWKGRC